MIVYDDNIILIMGVNNKSDINIIIIIIYIVLHIHNISSLQ